MNTRATLFLVSILAAALAVIAPSGLGVWTAFAAVWLVASFLCPQTAKLGVPTLTMSEILMDCIKAFTGRVPALRYFATDFSTETAKKGQTIIAHLPVVPVAYDHVSANGYSNNAQHARDLLVDVPVIVDQWKDVPIKIEEADVVQDRSENYLKTISNAGYVLGKAVVDYGLSKVLAANFTGVTTESIANTSSETLGKVREAMNAVDAGDPRYLICNSAFMGALDNDPRVTSSFQYAQRSGGDSLVNLRNIKGFAEVQEYPKFPANGENLAAFAFDSRAVALVTRLPADSTDLARRLGIPVNYTMDIVQDPQTGLAIVGFRWIDENTHTIFMTFSVMFGAVAGNQGGSAGAKTDYAGHRIVTS